MMNPVAVPGIQAVESLKSEMLRYLAAHPAQEPAAQGRDSVQISAAGKLLSDMARTDFPLSRAVALGLATSGPDPSLSAFLQAYASVYGVDFNYPVRRYGKDGLEAPEDAREELRKVLRSFRGYFAPEDPDETDDGFFRRLRELVRRVLRFLRGK